MVEDSMETSFPKDPTAADVEAALQGIIEQIEQIRHEMKAADDIARLKAETAELKAETRAILATLH
jgi:hypothetical protein